MGPELLRQADPGPHEVLARPDGRTQGDGPRAVGPERPEPVPVGAQDVGEDERVTPVVLVARGPVPGPQSLHVAARDDEHREPCREQGVDDRAVGALDRDPGDLCLRQAPPERPEPWLGVLDLEPLERRSALVDDADGVGAARPVDARVPGGTIHPVPPRWFQQPGGTLVSGTWPAVRLLSGARGAQPYRGSRGPCAPDPAELSLVVERRGRVAVVRRSPGVRPRSLDR